MSDLFDLRPTLAVGGVRLEPIAEAHRAGLAQAGAHPEIWTHLPTADGGFDAWFDQALAASAAGREGVFAVRGPREDVLVGSTRFMAVERRDRRLEIGGTWYAPSVWATEVNPACKLALMRHAFETLGCNRVEFKTDNLNLRSQAAIAKLGATREGVFRAHMVRRDGSLRDSVYFSIVRDEWPDVRQRLVARLALTLTTEL